MSSNGLYFLSFSYCWNRKKKKKKLVVAISNSMLLTRKEINTTIIFLNQMFVDILLVLPNCVQLNQYFKNKKINQIKQDLYI